MKKSAIYLGACAAILAIAGAFTTKGNTKVDPVTGFTINNSTVRVTCAGSQGTCTVNGATVYTSKAHANVIHTSI
jgi:hypothetical protein